MARKKLSMVASVYEFGSEFKILGLVRKRNDARMIHATVSDPASYIIDAQCLIANKLWAAGF